MSSYVVPFTLRTGVLIDSPIRPLMRSLAQPLNLGEMHERHFIFKDDWPKQLTRELAKDEYAGDPVTVTRLRAAIDQPLPRACQKRCRTC